MEVKIKTENGYVDAKIVMMNGDMIVSPKVKKFEPKDGDVVFSGSSLISIFKEMTSDTSMSAYAAISNGEFKNFFDFWSASGIRPATEEEKKLLFDKLAEEGLAWDADKKEIVKLKWKPKEEEIFHFPIFSDELGEFVTDYQEYYETIFMSIERGWYFKTEQECQEFCNRLNEATSQVKP